MTTQILVKPQGIVTEPNKVGQYTPGAAFKMTNVAIRSFGLMEAVRKWTTLSTFGSSAVMSNGGAYIRTDGRTTIILKQVFSTTWRVFIYDGLTNASQSFLISPSPINAGYLSETGRTGVLLFRNRLIIAGIKGSVVFDLYYDTGTAVCNGWARACGVAQPSILGRSSIGSTGTSPEQYLPANSHFNATVVNKLVHSDGYELISVPAYPSDYAQLSTTLASYGSSWSTYGLQTVVGSGVYKHEIYRTRHQSVGYDSGTNSYSPISCGSSYYNCKTIEDADEYEYNTKETTLPNQLGEALYVNNAASGAAAIATPPPPAKCAAAFRGYAFYANKFDPATFKLLTPYFWGPTYSGGVNRENGIGLRSYTARTATSGSPTITLTAGLGVVVGQYIRVFSVATGSLVANGTVIAFNTSTWVVTMSVNSSYSGSVDVDIEDVIELNGTKFGVGYGVSDFAQQIRNVFFDEIDVYSVGLEPQKSYDAGIYPYMGATGGITFRMRNNSPITLRATNGLNYSTFIPDLTAVTPLTTPGKQQDNAFAWSENNQPEYVPPANYAFVGNGEIYQIISTRDALWFWCSDGLYRLSGSGGSVGDGYDWVVDPIDPGLFLSFVNALCVHREYVYAFTNRGLVSVSSEGIIRELSDGRVNPAQQVGASCLPNKPWAEDEINSSSINNVWMCADAQNDDVLVRVSTATSNPIIWVYNTKTDTFTTRSPSAMASAPIVCAYNSTRQMLIGLDAATGSVFSSNGTGYEDWAVDFQPIYGTTSSKSAYTKKHWQDVNVSFKTPQNMTGVTLRLAFGPGSTPNPQSLEDRTIPVVDSATNFGARFPESARIGYTVPRVSPAIANSLSISMYVTGGQLNSGTGVNDALDTLVMEGMEVNFIDFSDERILR